MADSCNVPKDILESMQDVLDRRVKISIRRLVKMEVKADKFENRVLAYSPCRLFILTAKAPTKVETSFHFLDIQGLESKKPGQLIVTVEGKEYKFMAIDAGSDVMDHMVMHLALSLKQIFPAFPLERLIVKVDVQPEDRMKHLQEVITSMESKDVGPCGGFTTMYQCMCDFHSLPYREEVAWDVDTIYLSHDCRELRLQDFDHLPPKDLIPVLAALEHNTWFKSLNASNIKLSVEACNEVIKVMRRNAVLEEINLKNTGIKTDFVQKLSIALISNSGSHLQTVDLSSNVLEDKAVNHLLGALKTLSNGISSLDLSSTGITTRCINKLGETLSQNASSVMTSLTCLRLNDNGLKGEDFPMLYNFLSQPNSITTLDLSSTDCVLDSLCDPLLRGCLNLTTLKLSKTTFTHKRAKELVLPQSWKQLFASACSLEFIDLSSCKLPAEALKELLLGVASNRNLKNLHLDISSNELGSSGASALTSCMPGIKSIHTLDISNNGFDTDFKTMLPELGQNAGLKNLSIGRNFINIKPKHMAEVMTCLVTALLQEESALESLSLADSRLRMDTTYIINALGSNSSLLEIDISGNAIGDHGSRMLAKALQINTKLRKVVWDKNGVTAPGFEDVAEALKKNMSLKKMPFPVIDASASMRLFPERTESALQKIEWLLQRNHCPGRFTPGIAYRLQQGFLISSTQQILDRKIVQLRDSIQTLTSMGSLDVYAGDVTLAESLVKDADRSRQLLPGLQDIALESQSPGNRVDQQLQTMAATLTQTIEAQLKQTVADMLKCMTNQCPTVMAKEPLQAELREGCVQETSLPKDFTAGVLEGAAAEVYNMTGEMNLAAASLISDTVLDRVIEALSDSHKTLKNHLEMRQSGVYKDNGGELEVETSVDSFLKPAVEASPQMPTKRSSMWNRMKRPQSTMGQEAISIASPRQVQDKFQDISQGSTPIGSSEALDSFGDLPVAASKPLTHVTKGRARPPKSVRPTRLITNIGTTELEPTPDNGLPSASSSASSQPVPKVEISLSPPTTSSSRKTSIKDEPSATKGDKKQEDAGSSKPESKKWSPMSFIKGKSKEEKAAEKAEKDSKKSHSFSTGISNMFKKKDDKNKRPSVSEVPEPSHDAVDSKKEDVVGIVKETPKEETKLREKDNQTNSVKKIVDAPAPKEPTPTPVRPPRERSSALERSALLPPKDKEVKVKAPTLAKAEDSSLEDEAGDKKEDKSHDTKKDQPDAATSISKAEEDKKASLASSEATTSATTSATTLASAPPSGLPRLPPGAVKMGGLTALGSQDLMNQLKLKQVKRKSHMEASTSSSSSSPEDAKDVPQQKTPQEKNNNKTDKKDATTTLPPPPSDTTTTTTTTTTIEKSSKPEEPSKPLSSPSPPQPPPTTASSPLSSSSSSSSSMSTSTPTTTIAAAVSDKKDAPLSPHTPSSSSAATPPTQTPSQEAAVATAPSSPTPTPVSDEEKAENAEKAETPKPPSPIPPSRNSKPIIPSPAPRGGVPLKRPSSVVVGASNSASSSSQPPVSSGTSETTTSSTSEHKEPKSDRPLSIGPTPQVRPRPPPPLKPRPVIMPRPRKRDSEIEDNTATHPPTQHPITGSSNSSHA